MSVEWHGSAVKARVHQGIINGLEVCCFMVDAGAKRKCHVITNNLRSSIGHEVDKVNLVGEVSGGKYLSETGTEVKYAAYVELGTRFMTPRSYLRPAYEEVRPQINKIIEKQIAKALG